MAPFDSSGIRMNACGLRSRPRHHDGKYGAIAGMLVGLGVCLYYMFTTYPFFRDMIGITRPVADYLWFGMNPISAGVFGLPASMITIIIVSLLTSQPDRETQELVEHVRYPHLRGDIVTEAT